MRHEALAFLLVVAVVSALHPGPVNASPTGTPLEAARPTWGVPEPEPEPPRPPVFELTVGAKAGGGAEVWTSPSRRTFSYRSAGGQSEVFDIPLFDETRAGYNYAVGIFAEMRFFRYVGLEIGLFFARHTLFEDTDWSYTEIDSLTGQRDSYRTKTEQSLVFTSFHIPIIVKGVLPLADDQVRLSLGIGPEIAIGSYAFANFRHKSGDPLPLKGARSAFRDLGARSQNDVYLAIVFGVDVKAGDFRIPIDLRFAYNFAQPANYYDRVEYDALPSDQNPNVHPTVGIFNARNSMYFQMTVGIAFDLL